MKQYLLAISRFLLYPFSFLYGGVICVRNWCYDWELLRSRSFDLPIICVGNLAVGGAGKTPTTEYLIRLLAPTCRLAVLSRGYGRKTKGLLLAGVGSDALEVGDEPAQLKRKFPSVTVAVAENRCEGIDWLRENHTVVLLDDAFQHRRVRAGLSILLFDYEAIRRKQCYLPSGYLREGMSGVKRAAIVLISKCPKVLDRSVEDFIRHKVRLTDRQAMFFTYIDYEPLQALGRRVADTSPCIDADTMVFLLTGIANPVAICAEILTKTKRMVHYHFPDHYVFKKRDVLGLCKAFLGCDASKKLIITTEKDAMRLQGFGELADLPVYYLPIRHRFIREQGYFDQLITDYVRRNSRNDGAY